MQIMAISGQDLLRTLWAALCQAIYPIIGWLFELFMNVANVRILSQADIRPIYARVTMMITIIMVFYVTFEFVKYVIQPDQMTDKEKGASKVVTKLIIVVLLIAFVPKLFDLSFDLQDSLLKNQTLSKLILGKSTDENNNQGRSFSANMFKMFYYVDEAFWKEHNKEIKDVDCDGVICDTIVQVNISSLAKDGQLYYLHNKLNEKGPKVKIEGLDKEEIYGIHFDGFIAVAVGLFMAYILVIYCVDLGVRAIQMAYLQVIAPIPIIGYLSPKKDNIFTKWLKQCAATYLDLFIRLSVMHFVLLIAEILTKAYNNGTLIDTEATGSIRTFTYVALILGLLLFMKKFPELIKELFPKMSAASGNLGLKAGDRVAPLAARALGAGLGATRLVKGAIARGVNTARRNREERERTGLTRKQQKAQIKANKDQMSKDRKAYNTALRERNKAARAAGKDKDPRENAQYKAAQQKLQQTKDAYTESKSKYANSQNTKYRSVVGNAVAGGLSGAATGMKTGFGATKLEEVRKKGWTEAGANVQKKTDAREQWLNEGGYSNVRRAVAGVEQKVGISTAAAKTGHDISRLDAQIKSNERLIATESDVKAKEDAAKDRSASKIESGEQKTKIAPDAKIEYYDIEQGKKIPIEVPPNSTTSSVYLDYKNKAESARADADAAAQAVQDLKAAGADEGKIKAAIENHDALEKEAKKAADMQGKVKKALQEYAITSVLKDRNNPEHDPVLVQKVDDVLTSIVETTRDGKTRDSVAVQLKKMGKAELITIYDDICKDGNARAHINDYGTLDDLQTALINSANERTRENVTIKGSKNRLEASASYMAQQSDDKSSNGGGKK